MPEGAATMAMPGTGLKLKTSWLIGPPSLLIDAIARIVPATRGTTQARKRKRAKYVLPLPPKLSKKY